MEPARETEDRATDAQALETRWAVTEPRAGLTAYELLEQRVEERTRELSTLLDVSRNVTSTLELQPLLSLILDQLKVVAEYHGAGIVQLHGQELRVIGYRGPILQEIALQTTFPAESLPVWDYLKRGEPVVIDDVRGDTPLARAYQAAAGEHLETTYGYVRCFLAVPLALKGRVIGALTLENSRPGYYSERNVTLALAIAQQAAIAIENAWLYQKAQDLAALEERQRLARELHDSVTQALFGIRVGVDTAIAQLDRDLDQAAESMRYVRTLAQGGMAEMRTLLFELRPESLETEGLVAGLQKQAAALAARHEVPVEAALGDEPAASLAVKEALYRITQEALHNTFKHAQPTSVELRLEQVDGAIVLEVRDDGCGFDAGGSYPGHLGLPSMKERATRLGGTLKVESAPACGTVVRARIPSSAES
jgi:signal transduction histidine kinase